MTRIKNILVGIDLSQADRLVASEISAANRHALDKALWLAKHASAKLTFISALELSAHTQHMIEEDPRNFTDVDNNAMSVLDEFVAQAKAENIAAESRLAYGPAWEEIINEVLKGDYDLVIVGTRNLSSVRRLLMGSTAMKLIRYCPCPVWVTKPDSETDTTSILVATDLSKIGASAVKVAAVMAIAEEAELHVLHAVEFPMERHLRFAQVVQEEIDKYRKESQEEAEEGIKKQLECEEVAALDQPPQVHFSTSLPETAIFEAIENHNIDLVVMGTVARGGLTRWLIGNTAERILPELPCSVLAVKPDDFKCPIKPE